MLSDDAVLGDGLNGDRVNSALLLSDMSWTTYHGIKKAEELLNQGSDIKVIVPINGVALTYKPIASEFVRLCKSVPERVWSSTIFEVTNVNNVERMSFLDDIAVILYSFCLTFGARILPTCRDLKIYSTCNYSGVALTMGNRPMDVEKIRPFLRDFAERTERCRLKAYLHDIATPEIVDLARETGIRFVDGNVVKSPESLPGSD
ncbi:MAG: hypothetical protein H7841_05760 [Magnetospirillum sp. WYHS-4]